VYSALKVVMQEALHVIVSVLYDGALQQCRLGANDVDGIHV
jgi:hypothetical protein